MPAQWSSNVPTHDDFGSQITDEFIDGKTIYGPWALMSPVSWPAHGVGQLGTGLGQRYCKDESGKWFKVEG